MAHTIEVSKSNRASCRTCKNKIEKGVLRFGEEVPNNFDPDGGPAYVWHHMECAAKSKAPKLKEAMDAYTSEIANKKELEDLMANAKPSGTKGAAKGVYPYAERAATGRSKCIRCDEAIEKGTLRIAVEREVDTGSFTTTGPGYLHPACAIEHTGEAALLEKIKANSPGLNASDLTELESQLARE
jgi:hypothetical protein